MKIKYSLLILIFFSIRSFAQFTDFHPELDWYTIKGKHVEVHFHEGAERTAQVVAKIADEYRACFINYQICPYLK